MRAAVFAVLAVICWHTATVKLNFGGNWTALWCTGALRPVPPEWEASTYRFPNTHGYDGQLYRLVAHDPFFRKGYAQYQDEAGLRYRRILIPVLAYAAALGRPLWIDRTYYLLELLFIGLGTFWLSRWFESHDWRGWLGLGFLILPATLVSIDRMVVDVALAAFVVGFVLLLEKEPKPTPRLWILVALAGLVRETGVLLIAACVLWLLWEKRLRAAAVFALAALPTALWYLFVQANTRPFSYPSSYIPFRIMLQQLFTIENYGPQVPLIPLVRLADAVAILGMFVAVVLAALWFRSGLKDPVKLAALLFTVLCVFLQRKENWLHVYDFGRVYTPLLLLLAMDAARNMRLAGAIPLLMVVPRCGIMLGGQLVGMLRVLLA